MSSRISATPHVGDTARAVVQYGLGRSGARPALGDYTRQLWQRRRFITAFATASNSVGYSGSVLGQAWQVLTPLLNVSVYYLVFGVLLHTKRGVPNFIAFLVIGLFVFSFSQTAAISGARAVTGNAGLTRTLPFPRAVLPVSTTLMALQRLLYSMLIMLPIVILTGERPALRWLLLVPAVGLQTLFCLGVGLLMARVGAKLPDTSQLLPFILRIWLYVSGIFYNVTVFTAGRPQWVKTVLQVNPGRVYVDLGRHALIANNPIPRTDWPLAVGWALAVLAVGYVVFWQGEEQYGRV